MTDSSETHRHTVLGLGGVFLRSADPEALATWYRRHLGFDVHDFGGGAFGAIFSTTGIPTAADDVQLWTAFPAGSDYFPASQPVMINFRVADLDGLLAQLRADGVAVDDHVERGDNGSFGWCTDVDGNRIELWQAAAAAV